MVVDHFRLVQLANKMLSTVLRHTTAEIRVRCGRATEAEREAGRGLLCIREDLTDEHCASMWNALQDEGQIGQTLLTASKEFLCSLLALARTGADRSQIGQARGKFFTSYADSDIPEVRRLATTIDGWPNEIAALTGTGHSNAKSEGINRVIKPTAGNCPDAGTRQTNAAVHAASPPVPERAKRGRRRHPAACCATPP